MTASDDLLPRLERAIRIIAWLIDQDGDAYWPILDRLEAERDALLTRKKRLEKYLGTGHAPQQPIFSTRIDL